MLTANVKLIKIDKDDNILEESNHLCMYQKDLKQIESYLSDDPLLIKTGKSSTQKSIIEAFQPVNQNVRLCDIRNWFKGDIEPNDYQVEMDSSRWKLFSAVTNDMNVIKLVVAKYDKPESVENTTLAPEDLPVAPVVVEPVIPKEDVTWQDPR